MFFREEALATDRFPQIVFLEFFPKPYEVIFKSEFADVEQLFAFFKRRLLNEIDKFRFTTTRTSIDNNVIKSFTHDSYAPFGKKRAP